MIMLLIKWWINAFEWLLGALIFNRDLPSVARVVADIPYGGDREQRLDVFVPHGSPPFPILVFVHGGAWVGGEKNAYIRICRSFAAEGFLVVNINYRLAPRHVYPSGFVDLARALAWVVAHAGQFGGDPGRIFLAGDSAGAHITSWYAAALHKPALLESVGIREPIDPRTLRGLLLFYGVYDCEAMLDTAIPFYERIGRHLLNAPLARLRERAREASTITHVTPAMAPCFVTAGERDVLHSQSVALVAKLKEHRVPTRALFFARDKFPDAFHAFLNFKDRACSQIAMRDAIDFMKEHINK